MEQTYAWQVSHTGVKKLWDLGINGEGIIVGHLDTGVSNNHPALKGKIAHFGMVNDHWEVEQKAATDINDHGTHLAGLICGEAIDNYHYSMAPGAKLSSIQCHGTGTDLTDTLVGLDWLQSNGVKLICLPMGIKRYNPILEAFFEALRRDGVLVICPSGNYGPSVITSPGHSFNCLSVGSLDPDGSVSDFSGSHWNSTIQKCEGPDLLVPGSYIYSLAPNGQMAKLSGTSQSCAIAAGCIALLMQTFPSISPWRIAQALLITAGKTHLFRKEHSVKGTINLGRAYEVLQKSAPFDAAIVGKTPPSFIDPKLKRLIKSNKELNCIVVAQKEFDIQDLISETSGIVCYKLFKQANTAIIKARSRPVMRLMQSEHVQMMSYCV